MASNLPAQTRPGLNFAIGNTTKALVESPYDLIDCYEEYEKKAAAEGNPVSKPAFVSFACRRFGIDNRWWGRHSRGDKDASKIPGLRAAVTAIEARIAGHLADGGLKGNIHGGLAAHMLKQMEDRDELVAEKEARAAQQQAPVVPPELIANLIHPDCTHEMLADWAARGMGPVLYTRQQLEAGMPLIAPRMTPPPPPPPRVKDET